MNKKITLALSFILLFFTSVNAVKKEVKITGTIAGLAGREVALLDYDRSELARVKGDSDAFEITCQVETNDGRFYILYVPALGDLGPSMKIPTLAFFIDAPNIAIDAKIEEGNLKENQITGSPDMTEYKVLSDKNSYNKELKEVIENYNKAFHQYNEVEKTEKNMLSLKEASAKIDSVYPKLYDEYASMIPQYRKSNALVVYLYSYYASATMQKQMEMINSFDKSMRNNYFIKQMLEKMEQVKACEVGQPAPDFELISDKGESVKLSSLKGKYVLIDFWASWCGPCKKEIPNLKKVYEEYKDKGLQLIGVSIDDSEARWRKAIEEEQLHYLQLLDAKKVTMKLYDYQGIPFIILLSPEGVILAKGLRGNDVKATIQEYIK